MARYRYHHLHMPQLHRQAKTIDRLGLKSSGEFVPHCRCLWRGPRRASDSRFSGLSTVPEA